jgi:sugar lactone lactonase YvrE
LAHGKLYVADAFNHRVLRYDYPIEGNQPFAELVFGQPLFGMNASGTTTNTFSFPTGLDVDSTGRLWVAEPWNHRVVWFDNAYAISANQPDADGVLGQPDFVTAVTATAQSGMNGPRDIVVAADGTLFVADQLSNRVLRFDNAASKLNGADADGVLGQVAFTTAVTATSQSGMNGPRGVTLLDDALFVADTSNARVLRFDGAANGVDGANADGVLGQAVYTTSTAAITQGGLTGPTRVAVDCRGQLYVSDAQNVERVLVYTDAISKPNGGLADNILGQADFTSGGDDDGPNRFNLDIEGSGMATDFVRGLFLVADSSNSRVLIFQASAPFGWRVHLPSVLRGY